MNQGSLQTILLGVVALAILAPLGFIEVQLVQQGHAEVALALTGPLAGSVVAFFFAHGSSFLAQAGATAQRADLLGLVNSVLTTTSSTATASGSGSPSVPPIPTTLSEPPGNIGIGSPTAGSSAPPTPEVPGPA